MEPNLVCSGPKVIHWDESLGDSLSSGLSVSPIISVTPDFLLVPDFWLELVSVPTSRLT